MTETRTRHFNTPGHAHELTFSCYKGRNYLSDAQACKVFLEEVELARLKFNFDLLAYVIMPNHAHLLLWPEHEKYDIAEIQRGIKGRTSRRYSELLMEKDEITYKFFLVKGYRRVEFRFWQRGGGFDRNFWNARPLYSSMSYIENNPVRKGLAAKAADWEWSSAWEGTADYCRPVIERKSIPVLLI